MAQPLQRLIGACASSLFRTGPLWLVSMSEKPASDSCSDGIRVDDESHPDSNAVLLSNPPRREQIPDRLLWWKFEMRLDERVK